MDKPIIVVSASSLARHPACQRALAFTYITRLRRLSTEPYFVLGRAFHAGLASYYTYRSVTDAIKAAHADIQKAIDSADRSTITISDRITLQAEAERLIHAYCALSSALDAEDGIRPIAVENRFHIPLHNGPDGDAYCVGVIDLYADSVYGPCVIDHKTASSCGASYFNRAEYDIQAALYMIAAERLGILANTFLWNVTTKTKTPYIKRHTLVPDRQRLDRYTTELTRLTTQLLQIANSYPGQLGDSRAALTSYLIEAVPGNPGACRGCPFTDLCDYPTYIEDFLNSDFTVSTYEEWGIQCSY